MAERAHAAARAAGAAAAGDAARSPRRSRRCSSAVALCVLDPGGAPFVVAARRVGALGVALAVQLAAARARAARARARFGRSARRPSTRCSACCAIRAHGGRGGARRRARRSACAAGSAPRARRSARARWRRSCRPRAGSGWRSRVVVDGVDHLDDAARAPAARPLGDDAAARRPSASRQLALQWPRAAHARAAPRRAARRARRTGLATPPRPRPPRAAAAGVEVVLRRRDRARHRTRRAGADDAADRARRARRARRRVGRGQVDAAARSRSGSLDPSEGVVASTARSSTARRRTACGRPWRGSTRRCACGTATWPRTSRRARRRERVDDARAGGRARARGRARRRRGARRRRRAAVGRRGAARAAGAARSGATACGSRCSTSRCAAWTARSAHRLLDRARRRWRDATLLCATHDVDDALAFDRVLVIEDGRWSPTARPPSCCGARAIARCARCSRPSRRCAPSSTPGAGGGALRVADGTLRGGARGGAERRPREAARESPRFDPARSRARDRAPARARRRASPRRAAPVVAALAVFAAATVARATSRSRPRGSVDRLGDRATRDVACATPRRRGRSCSRRRSRSPRVADAGPRAASRSRSARGCASALLRGAFALDPGWMRREGPGRVLGRAMEVDAVGPPGDRRRPRRADLADRARRRRPSRLLAVAPGRVAAALMLAVLLGAAWRPRPSRPAAARPGPSRGWRETDELLEAIAGQRTRLVQGDDDAADRERPPRRATLALVRRAPTGRSSRSPERCRARRSSPGSPASRWPPTERPSARSPPRSAACCWPTPRCAASPRRRTR